MKNQYGIEGQIAPELKVGKWIDGKGTAIDPVQLTDYEGKFKIIYGFQAWCPGCHSQGLPALKKMVDATKDNDKVAFLAIQTVFEGAHANTYEKVLEIQKEYGLEIPFGHDAAGDNSNGISNTMVDYQTGGTPWFILIDQNNQVVFNDFQLNTDNAIELLQGLDK